MLPDMDFTHFRHPRWISYIKLMGAIHPINFKSSLSNLNYSFLFPMETNSAHLLRLRMNNTLKVSLFFYLAAEII